MFNISSTLYNKKTTLLRVVFYYLVALGTAFVVLGVSLDDCAISVADKMSDDKSAMLDGITIFVD